MSVLSETLQVVAKLAIIILHMKTIIVLPFRAEAGLRAAG